MSAVVSKNNGELFIKEQQSTAQMFEEYYKKPFAEITPDDLGSAEEIDWGEQPVAQKSN